MPALQSPRRPLVAQPCRPPDLLRLRHPLPYATGRTTSCGLCVRRAARPWRAGSTTCDARLRPTTATASGVIDDAAQHALMDAEMPTTFPADATGVEESVARFIDNLSKQIFQAEDALTEGYDKPGSGVALHPGDGPPVGGVLQRLPRLLRVGVEEDAEGVVDQ
ncbi:hypothetical protein ZWY2020_015323 [Hordeum vulgare]|nr:hypothetical protein ZWY2020_015323 [Hordeum vulgare]